MKRIITIAGTAALMAPLFLFAAGPSANFGDIGASITAFLGFIDNILTPLVFALAFLMFIWGMFKYFFLSGASEEGRSQGKQLILWGVIAFVVMVCVWGLVKIVSSSLNLNNAAPTLPSIPLPRV